MARPELRASGQLPWGRLMNDGRGTILVVDDDSVLRRLLGTVLKLRGYTVLPAEDGVQALKVLGDHDGKVDLVLVDIIMPVMDGWDAIKILKEDESTKSIPVIALSAHAMEEHRERAMAAGADDYDTKPVDLERLLGKINSQLPS